ncbi:type II toxin-antitoxin system PemK/MazF family toxin [Tychonema sp. LEGE 06208]|uniref:type II toxin-antitoxin system PemK/MazF family toxin n=1 Tax=Tychonema sp. LEGE 06208 TaxID=1828663 RepID=UPI00187E1A94|nr:type II toxin-antitoxin system PemK/MazF family toxin [Tychonema sp. LEGE 06208]MBE9161673.1 type II toxin-antitoxin system PemK/MazF family toxin [Tychonema sp. LEGE 06208]
MAASSDYRLGSIWLVNFDPSVGTEIRKTRPAVIISGTAFNQRSKVTVLPITSAVPNEGLRAVVLPVIPSTLNGLNTESFIVCVDPMTFDKRRLVRCLGQLELQQISEIQLILARYLELED